MHAEDRPPPGTVLIALVLATLVVAGLGLRSTRPVIVDASGRRIAGEAAAWPDMRLDPNRATAGELATLPGIGGTLARRIVEDRMRCGPFGSLDELARVDGIGPATVKRIRPMCRVERSASRDGRDVGPPS